MVAPPAHSIQYVQCKRRCTTLGSLLIFGSLLCGESELAVEETKGGRRLNCHYASWKKAMVCDNGNELASHARGIEPPPGEVDHPSYNSLPEYNDFDHAIKTTERQQIGIQINATNRFCSALGSPPPLYLAVVARWDEDVEWTKRLPIPTLIYEHAKPEAKLVDFKKS